MLGVQKEECLWMSKREQKLRGEMVTGLSRIPNGRDNIPKRRNNICKGLFEKIIAASMTEIRPRE